VAIYEYKAFDGAGKIVKGIVEADNKKNAGEELRKKKLFVSEIKASTDKIGFSDEVSLLKIIRKIHPREIAVMTRQLATLLKAGVPIVQALSAIVDQLEGRPFQKVLIEIKEKVNQGWPLADAFEEHPRLFGEIFVSMVRAGAAAGALDVTLSRLSDFTEKSIALKHKVKAELAYPFFMIIMGVFVLGFLLSFVVPTIAKLFTEMNQKLPLPTVILIEVSAFFKRFIWLIIILIGAGCFLFKKNKDKKNVRDVLDKIKLRLPLFGLLMKKMIVSRFVRMLGTLLAGSIPVEKALGIVEKVLGNTEVVGIVEKARKEITAGASISEALKQNDIFQPIVVHMIAVGESSGKLEEMFFYIADTYDEEVAFAVDTLTSLLEPVIIVIMGVVVGFIVLSILLPIFEMNQIIR